MDNQQLTQMTIIFKIFFTKIECDTYISSGNPNWLECLFTTVVFLTCWGYPDIYLFISYYADSLLLFWDLIF